MFVDVINLFNQREVASVDDDYTYSLVAPIRGAGRRIFCVFAPSAAS